MLNITTGDLWVKVMSHLCFEGEVELPCMDPTSLQIPYGDPDDTRVMSHENKR